MDDKLKIGDLVKITDKERSYCGIYADVVYEIVGRNKRNNLPLIRSTDPNRKIDKEICVFDVPESTDYQEHNLKLVGYSSSKDSETDLTMAKTKFKVGDIVTLNKSNYSPSWENSYNLKLKARYEVIKIGSYNAIKAVNPDDPIKYNCSLGKGVIELDNSQLDLDEDWMKERFEQLFG